MSYSIQIFAYFGVNFIEFGSASFPPKNWDEVKSLEKEHGCVWWINGTLDRYKEKVTDAGEFDRHAFFAIRESVLWGNEETDCWGPNFDFFPRILAKTKDDWVLRLSRFVAAISKLTGESVDFENEDEDKRTCMHGPNWTLSWLHQFAEDDKHLCLGKHLVCERSAGESSVWTSTDHDSPFNKRFVSEFLRNLDASLETTETKEGES